MSGQTVARWRAWYTEARVFDGETFADWQALPEDGLLCVMVLFEDGTSRYAAGNNYYWSTPDLCCAHSNDPLAEIEDRYPGASVKRGKWTSEAEMKRVHDEAFALAGEWLAEVQG